MDFDAVIHYLKENYRDTSVKETADHFGYSESHFCRVFKKKIGISPQEFLVALKVENSVYSLMSKKQTVLKTQLKSGYLSEGTFTNRIKKSMTLSPKQLSRRKSVIFEEYKSYENEDPVHPEEKDNDITVHLFSEELFEGIVFVGLFKKPIPNQVPVIGKIITNFRKNNTVAFNNIPPGTYYCLACVIHKTLNPVNLFVHKDNLRGRVEECLTIPGKYNVVLQLRPPLPVDPPITLNLPLMFINTIKDKKDEYRAD